MTTAADQTTDDEINRPKTWRRLMRLLGDRERLVVRGPGPVDRAIVLTIVNDSERQTSSEQPLLTDKEYRA